MVTATETRKSIEKRIDELLAEKSEVLMGAWGESRNPLMDPSVVKKLAEIDEAIQGLNASLYAVNNGAAVRAQRAVEDADIAERREAYPLH